ncbi:MAG TPA: hypothetical protein VK996_10610 [Ramlibacter sp.]|nr:hypothetical protein [Ramlibacter sp.]
MAATGGAGLAPGATVVKREMGSPQPPQNFADAAIANPHDEQWCASAPPQFSQNRFESGFAV